MNKYTYKDGEEYKDMSKLRELKEVLRELAGNAGFNVWNVPKPKGVFDSEQALKAVDQATKEIKALIIAELEKLKDKTDEFDLPIEDSWTNYGLDLAIKKVGEL